METICGYTNMQRTMVVTTYKDIANNIHRVFMETAGECMQNAAEEISEENLPEDAIANVAISAGTWQRRRYSSLNGTVTIIVFRF